MKRAVGTKRAQQLVETARSSIDLTEGLPAAKIDLKHFWNSTTCSPDSSGKKKGKSSIIKRGRARLRALLFRAVMLMVAKNAEFKALHQYFTKRSQNPLKKKQLIVALCGKLIRVLHTLGTKQVRYDANDVLGPVREAQLQKTA
ncbi:transposase [Paenibacillus sp. S02]|uniref:transposase n=1 Tax=Paenibacillus sp. S02 TaxID=2823904 RepID=UPI0021AC6968|nr:transposase [Paenibacillus sp. S02]QYK68700.1 hypothetical protein KAI36_03853 [Paenibacillus sp. S02]